VIYKKNKGEKLNMRRRRSLLGGIKSN